MEPICVGFPAFKAEAMRLKPVDGHILVENSNSNLLCDGSSPQTLTSDGNRNTTTNFKYTSFNRRSQWESSWTEQKTELVSNLIFKAETPNNQEISQEDDDSIADYEEGEDDSCSSSEEALPECDCSDSSDLEDRTLPNRGIVNPNYPGFQHLADQLHSPQDAYNNNNNDPFFEPYDKEIFDSVNKLDTDNSLKSIYTKPKLNIPVEEDCTFAAESLIKQLNKIEIEIKQVNKEVKEMASVLPDLKKSCGVQLPSKEPCLDTNRTMEENDQQPPPKEKEEEEEASWKKEKMEKNLIVQKSSTQPPSVRPRSPLAPPKSRRQRKIESAGSFDVYNIETAMPKIDLDAIESHLRAAREEERRRRNDREEIRRRLATGDNDEYYGSEHRPGRKPSLQARLQSGMNLQICFMNETMSDTESPCSEAESPLSLPAQTKPKLSSIERPRSLNVTKPSQLSSEAQGKNDGNFFERQARLQSEARVALSQAKDLARMQMQAERQRLQISPITEMLRASLQKVGVPFPEGRRRVSRQMLTDMNVAQLQVIVNDLHTQIEILNEGLVKYLMERDELHMRQDSMLVDIEDLTRYFGAKENLIKEDITQNNNVTPVKPPMMTRIVSLGKK